MNGTGTTLLALQGLRLTGLAEADAVARVTGADPHLIEVELAALARHGLVLRRDGSYRSGWLITESGRQRATELVACELDRTGARPALEAVYRRFTVINPELLDLCCRWQLRDVGRQVRNDHTDAAYDRSVVADLALFHQRAQPVVDALIGVSDRFRCYGPRLAHALGRVTGGDTDYFTRPVLSSYHTVWFELHEDLLTTLGLDRASETARLSRSGIST